MHSFHRIVFSRTPSLGSYFLFFFNDTATTEIYTLSLHDALPIYRVERDESRARVGRRAGLVEPDVPALPDPEELEVDAPRRRDRLLVRRAVLGERLTRQAPVGNVDVLGPDVHEREQCLPNVAPIAGGAVRRHRVVLVEVERHDAREIALARPVAADQLAIDPEGRAARGEAEHAPLPLGGRAGDDRDDPVGEPPGEIVVVGDHDGAEPLAIACAGDDVAELRRVSRDLALLLARGQHSCTKNTSARRAGKARPRPSRGVSSKRPAARERRAPAAVQLCDAFSYCTTTRPVIWTPCTRQSYE